MPATGRFSGFAVPGTIFVVEDRGFLTDRSDPQRIDAVSKRVAHEVAHQWWGHQVAPAERPGASALVETLARYTEQRVLAALHGEPAVPPVLAFELDRYLTGRAGGDEPPLAAVEDQSYLYYSKGALVMAAMRDLIGERATNAALRHLVTEARAGRQPDVADLLASLQREATAAQRLLIAEWWNAVVLYDLRLARARATPVAGSRLRLDLDVTARKSAWHEGREAPLALDEELEIAVYSEDPGVGGRGGVPLHLGRHRLRGDARISLEVAAGARYVLVDPNLLRIDRNRADNLRPVELAGGG